VLLFCLCINLESISGDREIRVLSDIDIFTARSCSKDDIRLAYGCKRKGKGKRGPGKKEDEELRRGYT